MRENIIKIKKEINKTIIGKEEIIEKTLAAILAGGHILLEDIPGVGKTTLALAFSKGLGLDFQRIQFTPDVVPSDITGYTVYQKGTFEYKKGAILCNFFLADEINRTSSKTQSALLEAMEEGRVTVDGVAYDIPKPFTVMATQNPIGTAGTQRLPEAQLDRFMIQLSMGYPDFHSQIKILQDREKINPLQQVKQVITKSQLEEMKVQVKNLYMDKKLFEYVTTLVEKTRNHPLLKLGVSPRGALALCAMAKSEGYMRGRDYVIADDIDRVFLDVCLHRIILAPKAQLGDNGKEEIVKGILEEIDAPLLNHE